MATSAERQRAFRARKRAEGLVAFNAMVPANQVGALMELVNQLCGDRDLEVSGPRSARSGRLVKLGKTD